MEPRERVNGGNGCGPKYTGQLVGGSSEAWNSITCPFCTPPRSPAEAIGESFSFMKVSSPLPLPRLDMCTETLGCETGARYTVSDYDRDLMRCNGAAAADKDEGDQAMRHRRMKKRTRRRSAAEFPPPLTVLYGESCLRIMSTRENGRLLLFPVKPSLMEAHREDGCLKIRLLSSEPLGDACEKQIEAEETWEGEEGDRSGMEMDGNGINGGNGNGMEDVAIGKYTRHGGCKEEGGGAGCLGRDPNTKRMLTIS